jgi:hypothetical protein
MSVMQSKRSNKFEQTYLAVLSFAARWERLSKRHIFSKEQDVFALTHSLWKINSVSPNRVRGPLRDGETSHAIILALSRP